jgi:hypothetical protein
MLKLTQFEINECTLSPAGGGIVQGKGIFKWGWIKKI